MRILENESSDLNTNLDEARFNLATHVMSNGVELIIASDKLKHVDKLFSRIPSSSNMVDLTQHQHYKPVTLAPSTLKNQMILARPSNEQTNFTLPINGNLFTTKTCLTTYTYWTTYLQSASTTTESREKVISNLLTIEQNYLDISMTPLPAVTLTKAPEFVVRVFPTTYYYYNTVMDNDLPILITSSCTVLNTLTGPDDYIRFLQPSEEAAPIRNTNTYFKPITLTRTRLQLPSLVDAAVHILTQVIVTESVFRSFSMLKSNYALNETYILKFKDLARDEWNASNSAILASNVKELNGLHVYATKTFVTTLTYLKSTLTKSIGDFLETSTDTLKALSTNSPQATGVNYYTRVIQNVVTHTVPNTLLSPDLLLKLREELIEREKNHRKEFATIVTLLGGETLEVTAIDVLKSSNQPNLLKNEFSLLPESVTQSLTINNDITSRPTLVVTYPISIGQKIQNKSAKLNFAESGNENMLTSAVIQPTYSTKISSLVHTETKSSINGIVTSFQLYQLQPVFNVMAEFLQNKLLNSRKREQRKPHTEGVISTTKRPLYIPVREIEEMSSIETYIRAIRNGNSNDKKLPRQSLNISPPIFKIQNNTKHKLSLEPKQNISYRQSIRTYDTLPINSGIPIRPGENITASADVIIGKPNGIQFSKAAFSIGHVFKDKRPQNFSLIELNNNVQNMHKKKIWSLNVPLSRVIPLNSANAHKSNKTNMKNYQNILNSLPIIQAQESSAWVHQIRPPLSQLANMSINDNRMYALPEFMYLKSKFRNNEIIDIKRIPEIYSTSFPPAISEHYYQKQLHLPSDNLEPSVKFASHNKVVSGYHHVSFRNDVLSHTVNIHVPHLTFKKEMDNLPYVTSFKGHMALPTMPMIKIPAYKTQVQIQMTPIIGLQNPISNTIRNQIALGNSIIQQGNHNAFLEHANNAKLSKSSSTHNSFLNNRKIQLSAGLASIQHSNLKISKPVVLDVSPTASILHWNVVEKNVNNRTVASKISNYSINRNKALERYIEQQDVPAGTISNWISQGSAFVEQNRPSLKELTSSTEYTIKKNIFVATGQSFKIRSEETSSPLHKNVVVLSPITNLTSFGINEKYFNTSKLLNNFKGEKLLLTPSKTLRSKKQTKSKNNFDNSEPAILQTNHYLQYPLLRKSEFYKLNESKEIILSVNSTLVPEKQSNLIKKDIGSIKPSISQITKKKNNSIILKTKLNPTSTKIFTSESFQTHAGKEKLIKKFTPPILESSETSNNIVVKHNIKYTRTNTPYRTQIANLNQNNSFTQKFLLGSEILSSQTDHANNINILLQHGSVTKTREQYFPAAPSIPNIKPKPHEIVNFQSKNEVPTMDYSGYNNMTKSPVLINDGSNIALDFPSRGDVRSIIDSKNVAVAGVFISYPSERQNITEFEEYCDPSCKSSRNEMCTRISPEHQGQCKCRPGFSRLFPDRPCKQTYTYEMDIPISHLGKYLLKFTPDLTNKDSKEHLYLSSIILDAVDRMVMQSDIRDIYHAVQLKSFSEKQNSQLITNLLLQLSENRNEKILEDAFKKYLRVSNHSIGRTELYSSKDNFLRIKDYDECNDTNFHDCSANAYCFNLAGSYTCSCRDEFADLSDNTLYPGRYCSDRIIGCKNCNYNGKCINSTVKSNATVCKCFAWHVGEKCQINLRILILCFIAIAAILFFSFTFHFFLMYVLKNIVRATTTVKRTEFTIPSFQQSILSISTNKSKMSNILSQNSSTEKLAIIVDSGSEGTHSSVPYLDKDDICVSPTSSTSTHSKYKESSRKDSHVLMKPKAKQPFQSHLGTRHHSLTTVAEFIPDQLDRSLTVIIPRAKYYHPSVLSRNQLNDHQYTLETIKESRVFKTNTYGWKTKKSSSKPLLDFADVSTTEKTNYKKSKAKASKRNGSLVSAGFNVSTIVSDNGATSTSQSSPFDGLKSANNDVVDNDKASCFKMLVKTTSLHDKMTVQEVTNSMGICSDSRTQRYTIDEANTMAERDLGSTFLLPHTHLYKHEKQDSDFSGFESI